MMETQGDAEKKPKVKQKHYFVPGEIGFIVQHPVGTRPTLPYIARNILETLDSPRLQNNQITGALRERLQPFLQLRDREIDPPRLTRLTNSTSLFVKVNNDDKPVELLKFIKVFNNQIVKPKIFEAGLAAATVNWLSGAQQTIGGGTGGPGGYPVPATAKRDLSLSANVSKAIGTETARVSPATSVNLGEKPSETVNSVDHVNVYVLDTAPAQGDVESQRQAWSSLNPLINTLFGQSPTLKQGNSNPYDILTWDGNFTIYYDTSPDADGNPLMQTLVDVANGYHLPANHYNMCDHGLFIASQVAQQYPNFFNNLRTWNANPPPVRIHLIQVLSDYGVGTFETFLRGLGKVIDLQQREQGIPAVVNCSWVLSAPGQLEHMLYLFEDDDADGLGTLECYFMGEIAKAKRHHVSKCDVDHYTEIISFLAGILALRRQIAYLTKNNLASIVACAGNDRKPNQPRPSARFPAAYTDVVGVAALSQQDVKDPATYANIADDPSNIGFAIWGGEVVKSGAVDPDDNEPIFITDDSNSPVGLYFNPNFPDAYNKSAIPNQYGLAHWAGSSFAAPLITATFAASMAWAQSPDFSRAKNVISKASDDVKDPTDQLEKTIYV